jgi:hypothetical protein
VVALEWQLRHSRSELRGRGARLVLAGLAGGGAAATTAIGLGVVLDLPDEVLRSLIPKSVTAPVAISGTAVDGPGIRWSWAAQPVGLTQQLRLFRVGEADPLVTLAITTGETSVVVGGLVDRLAVLPDRVLLADYKTTRVRPAGPEGAPVAYLRQMAAYREVLRGAFPGRRVVCALVWTVGAAVMPLPDSLLDGHVPGSFGAAA